MKRIIIAILLVAGSFGFLHAQDKQTKTTVKRSAAMTKTATVKAKDSMVVKKSGLKKDGTPDMRLKKNKEVAKTATAGPLKKNGTADMRYKDNKARAKTK